MPRVKLGPGPELESEAPGFPKLVTDYRVVGGTEMLTWTTYATGLCSRTYGDHGGPLANRLLCTGLVAECFT